jgi:hypothetical protein
MEDVVLMANPEVLDLLDSDGGPARRAQEAMDLIETQVLLDEFRALPVGNRLAAKYWALRTTVSPIALEAHRRASVTLASAQAEARA